MFRQPEHNGKDLKDVKWMKNFVHQKASSGTHWNDNIIFTKEGMTFMNLLPIQTDSKMVTVEWRSHVFPVRSTDKATQKRIVNKLQATIFKATKTELPSIRIMRE
jgi:hypothetical protein